MPAVTAKGNVLTTDETVHLSADEATWIGLASHVQKFKVECL